MWIYIFAILILFNICSYSFRNAYFESFFPISCFLVYHEYLHYLINAQCFLLHLIFAELHNWQFPCLQLIFVTLWQRSMLDYSAIYQTTNNKVSFIVEIQKWFISIWTQVISFVPINTILLLVTIIEMWLIILITSLDKAFLQWFFMKNNSPLLTTSRINRFLR